MLVYSGKDDEQRLNKQVAAGQELASLSTPGAGLRLNGERPAQLPFAYGLTDDPYSRAMRAVEDGE